MTNNHLLFGMAALFAATQVLTACSSEDFESQPVAPRQATTISLTTMLSKTRSTSDPQATQLNSAVKVGAFGVSGSTVINNGANNKYDVAANGDLTAASDEMEWPKDGSVSIYAYAPYQDGWSYNEANSFSVSTDQSETEGYLKSDLVYGTPAQNPVEQTEDAIALSFTHKLAKLNITIEKAEGATIDLTSASVTITGTKVNTTLTPSTGAIGEATGDATDIKAVAALGTATTACAIIVPQQLEAGTPLVKIIADGKQLIAKLGTATNFIGGKSYNFTVKVGKVEAPETVVTLKLGSTSIAEWGTENLGASDADGKLYATFGTPGGNATYEATTSTYTWTGSTNNLMNCFTFENGELANYTTLNFAFTELTDGASVRINVLYSDNTNSSKSYYTAGTKATPISDLLGTGKTAADVTAIRFGGNSNSGSTVVKASEMYFE